jgi:hypothetical protein
MVFIIDGCIIEKIVNELTLAKKMPRNNQGLQLNLTTLNQADE